MIIHKQILPVKANEYGKIEIDLPQGSEVLTINVQNGNMCIWYEFDEAEKETYKEQIMIVPTGRTFDDLEWYYNTTVFFEEFVWHIYLML